MDTDLDAQIREREKRSNDRVRKLRKERMAGDEQYAEKVRNDTAASSKVQDGKKKARMAVDGSENAGEEQGETRGEIRQAEARREMIRYCSGVMPSISVYIMTQSLQTEHQRFRES